mmetsp:Transcript_41107/g.106318  ORF Transcript_41107/g.106318 Transcript_41107/m.106318 type:complete len:318 (-) Transcript_41107:56-1009(-)
MAKIAIATLLAILAACPAALAQEDAAALLAQEDAAAVAAALDVDDQCRGGDAEQCALQALQLRAGKEQCDCAWASGGANCGPSDGSPCWAACCQAAMESRAATSCSNAVWTVAYSEDHCRKEDGALVIACNAPVGNQCGTRLSSSKTVGPGVTSMGIKAAPGAGVATTFYLSNNGGMYDKEKRHPWVEIDYEIMGHMAGPGGSKIWTNLFTGVAIEHNAWITVPFDVTAAYHEYGFVLSDTHVGYTVDGVVYRKVDISGFPDVKASISGRRLQPFISVWGKSSKDEGEGIPEFQEGLSKLDKNANRFPIYAGYMLPQ